MQRIHRNGLWPDEIRDDPCFNAPSDVIMVNRLANRRLIRSTAVLRIISIIAG